MPTLHLTDIAVRALAADHRQITFWDASTPAFGARVSPRGTKSWVLCSANAGNSGRSAATRNAARQSPHRSQKFLANHDRRSPPPRSRMTTRSNYFWRTKHATNALGPSKDYKRLLALFSFRSQLSEITPADAAKKLANIKARSEYDTGLVAAKSSSIGCLKRHYIDRNPFQGLSTHATTSRTRVLSDAELLRSGAPATALLVFSSNS